MPDLPGTGLSQAILDSLSEGVFTVDTDWRITSFNRSAEEITGVPRHEALGQLCSDVLHSTLCERHCPIRQALADNKPIIDRRCHVVDIDGERIPLSVSAAVLTGENGEVLGGVEPHLVGVEVPGGRLRHPLVERGRDGLNGPLAGRVSPDTGLLGEDGHVGGGAPRVALHVRLPFRWSQ